MSFGGVCCAAVTRAVPGVVCGLGCKGWDDFFYSATVKLWARFELLEK